MKTNTLPAFSLLLAASLALTGCGAGTSETVAPSASATPSAAPSPITIPAGAYGDRMTWILDLLNSTEPAGDDEITEAFEAETLVALGGVDGFRAVLDTQLRPLAPYTPIDYQEAAAGAGAVVSTTAGKFTVSLGFDTEDRLTMLLVAPFEEQPPLASDWSELESRVNALSADARLSVFDISDGTVTAPVRTFGDLTGVQPSGSTFKLFVLRAVVEAIDAGTLDWDTTLTVTDEIKSLPSGTYQNDPAGTTHSVRDAAGVMISESDNTATDMLLAAVGAPAVEAVMDRLDADGTATNTPMASTRSFFQLGWGDAALRGRWADAGADERRTILAEIESAPLTVTVADIVVPVFQDGVDWFYSDRDLALILTDLQATSETTAGSEVRSILEANPGTTFDGDWDAIQFKGGSSIGVVAGAWLLQDGEQTWVVTIHINSEDLATMPSNATFAYLASDAGHLLQED